MTRNKRLTAKASVLVSFAFFVSLTCQAKELRPRLISTQRIWDAAPHNAFTDLVRWKGRFYCAFREGKGHAGDLGNLRVLVSADGAEWQSAALLTLSEYDLRDAALSVTPEGKLMVLGGAQQILKGQHITSTFVSFSEDGRHFTRPKIVTPAGQWLWRVTWNGDNAYGVAYGAKRKDRSSSLLATRNGVDYDTIRPKLLGAGGWPTEARLRFTSDGTCYCLHRRDGDRGNSAFFGISRPPYQEWNWSDLGVRIGGPNFIQLPTGEWIGAGRLYDGGARTELFQIFPDAGEVKPLLRLPSGGDTSYPGLVWHDETLWISYYASHEEKTNIYLAQVKFESPRQVISLENRLDLFVDHHLIQELDSSELRLHHPRPAERVLHFDRPWEGPFCGYATIIQDGDRLRMYYRGLPIAGRDGSDTEVTCYAESRDGIKWTKPNLRIFKVNETLDNNVVLAGHSPASHNFSPFLDTNPASNSSHRYKALGGTGKGLYAFVSDDGIHWEKLHDDPVFTQGVFDSQNVSFFSTHEGCYVCYFRTWSEGGYRGFRSVSRTTSTNFVDWTVPAEMEFGKTPREHLYTNQTTAYFRAPHIYLGIAARFMPGRRVLTKSQAEQIGVDPKYFNDCSDCVLLTTRGGNQYERTFMEAFVRPGLGIQNWVSRTNYPVLGIVQTGEDELSIYLQKNYGQPTSHIQRYTLRVDGFASVHAGYQGGELLTKPLRFKADEQAVQLHLNYSTSAAGEIRVELQDSDGKPLPGFSAADCRPLIGDQIDATVVWHDSPDLNTYAGQDVQLRFILKDADLYSLQFR